MSDKKSNQKQNIKAFITSKIFLFYLILFLVITGAIWLYIDKFGFHQTSNDKGDWGTFGDYIGGVLNPVIGLANIVVFIHLTQTIVKIEDTRRKEDEENQERRSKAEIEHQKALFKFELKHRAYNEIADFLGDFTKMVLNNDLAQVQINITSYMVKFQSIMEYNAHIFPILNGREAIGPSFDIISKIGATINTIVKEKDPEKKNKMIREEGQNIALDKYTIQKGILLKKLQEDLMK